MLKGKKDIRAISERDSDKYISSCGLEKGAKISR